MSYKECEKPENVVEFEEAADSNDTFWLDGFHAEDMASVANWYRSEYKLLLAERERLRETLFKVGECAGSHTVVEGREADDCGFGHIYRIATEAIDRG